MLTPPLYFESDACEIIRLVLVHAETLVRCD